MLSLEAREELAARALEQHAAVVRAELHDVTLPDFVSVDTSGFGALSAARRATEPARATLLAEAALHGRLRLPRKAYFQALLKHPATVREAGTVTPLLSVASAVTTDPIEVRREAIVRAERASLQLTRAAAQRVVEAIRGAREDLGADPLDALGIPDAPLAEALAASEDVWSELDRWTLRAHEIDRTRLTWADRLRSLVAEEIPRQCPPAMWTTAAFGWIDRVGMQRSLARLGSALGASSRQAWGVFPLRTEVSSRAVLEGRPSPAGGSALDVSGSACELLASVGSRAESPGPRLGIDRALAGVLHVLGRRLWLDRRFVARCAAVDPGATESFLLTALHAEAYRVRRDAVNAALVREAITPREGMTQRFLEAQHRAYGVSSDAVVAVHTAARAFEPDTQWNTRAHGALVEPYVLDALRARYDEDWFRNPKAGEGIVGMIDEMRLIGVKGWCEARGISPSPERLTRRLADAMADARKG